MYILDTLKLKSSMKKIIIIQIQKKFFYWILIITSRQNTYLLALYLWW